MNINNYEYDLAFWAVQGPYVPPPPSTGAHFHCIHLYICLVTMQGNLTTVTSRCVRSGRRALYNQVRISTHCLARQVLRFVLGPRLPLQPGATNICKRVSPGECRWQLHEIHWQMCVARSGPGIDLIIIWFYTSKSHKFYVCWGNLESVSSAFLCRGNNLLGTQPTENNDQRITILLEKLFPYQGIWDKEVDDDPLTTEFSFPHKLNTGTTWFL